MMIPFPQNDSILHTEPFLTDEVRFNLLHRICEGGSVRRMCREDRRAVIAQSDDRFPVWVWTAAGFGSRELNGLAQDFSALFVDNQRIELVAKPMVAEFLAGAFAESHQRAWNPVMEMEAYCCPQVLVPEGVRGELCHPAVGDAETIAGFFAGFIQDCFGQSVTAERTMADAERYIASENFYIWKADGQIVSMANIAHRSLRHARINEVYTPVLHRKKGYAGMLVAQLSRMILTESRVPMLYADLANPDSNKVYRRIGYQACGKVKQIALTAPDGVQR